MFLLPERDPLFGSYHFRRRNLCRPRKGKGHYGVASAEKCPRGEKLHGTSRLLPEICRRILKNSETHHHFTTQGGQV
jgi:hypothetical protein